MKKEFYRKKMQQDAALDKINDATKKINSLTAAADSLDNALKLINNLYDCLGKLEAAKERLQQMNISRGGNKDE